MQPRRARCLASLVGPVNRLARCPEAVVTVSPSQANDHVNRGARLPLRALARNYREGRGRRVATLLVGDGGGPDVLTQDDPRAIGGDAAWDGAAVRGAHAQDGDEWHAVRRA